MTLQEELIMLVLPGSQFTSEENNRRIVLWQERYNSVNTIVDITNIEIKATFTDTNLITHRPSSNDSYYGFTSKLFPDLPMIYIHTSSTKNDGLIYIKYSNIDKLSGELVFEPEKRNGLILNKYFELFEMGNISGFIQVDSDITSYYCELWLEPVLLIKVNDTNEYDKFMNINNQIKQIYIDSKPFSYIPVYTDSNEICIVSIYNKQVGIFEFIGNNLDLIKEDGKIKDIHCLDEVELVSFKFPELFYSPANMLIYSKSTGVCLNSIAKSDNLI